MLNPTSGRPYAPKPYRHGARLTLSLAALLLAGSQAPALTLLESGEWVVSCDNTATCALVNAAQRTQLRVAQPSPFGMARLCIHRRGGPQDRAQVFLTLHAHPPKKQMEGREARFMRIMGAKTPLPDIALHHRGMDHWEVPTAQVDGLLAELDENTRLHIVAGDGATLERLTVQGIEHALSRVDRAQQRVGSVTALREKGEKAAHTVPIRPALPSLGTSPLPKLAMPPAPSPEAVRLRRQACGTPGLDASIGYRLLGDQRRADRILWVTPCDPRPGLRRDFFVIENADGSAAPAPFPGFFPNRPTGQPGLLSTPRLEAETGLVSEQWIAPVPPPKDEACAIQRLWGWNGQAFELAQERRSLSCAGIVSGYWAKTYTRPLVTPAREGVPANASPFQPPC